MSDIINDFETIIILKTVIFGIDLNFLDLSDLEKIQECAYDMDIDITDYDLDDLYNSNYEKIKEIYCVWKEEVYSEFLEIKKELENIIKR